MSLFRRKFPRNLSIYTHSCMHSIENIMLIYTLYMLTLPVVFQGRNSPLIHQSCWDVFKLITVQINITSLGCVWGCFDWHWKFSQIYFSGTIIYFLFVFQEHVISWPRQDIVVRGIILKQDTFKAFINLYTSITFTKPGGK